MFHFTIRELILVTIIVALAAGWSLETRRTATWERRANWAAGFMRRSGWSFEWEEPHNFRSNPDLIFQP